MSARWAGALLACATALPVAAAGEKPSAAPATHVVRVENMQFNPPSLSVRRGDRIVWVNKDLFPHTVTSDTKAFDSRDIAPSASWTYRADRPGEYAYSCAYHPTMKAQITVR